MSDAVVAALKEHEGYAEVGDADLFRAFYTANIRAKVGPELLLIVLGIQERGSSPVGMSEFAKAVVLFPESFNVLFHAIEERENADGLGHNVGIGSAAH